jgi:hypothetical protein
MSKDESVNIGDLNIEDAVGEMVTKFTELTDMVNALTAKVTQQGVAQEGFAAKTVVQEEKGYDIGTSEAWQANMKHMFDSYLYLNLEAERRNRLHFDRMMANSIDADKSKNKQELAHENIATYKLWGLSPPTEYKDD